MQRPPRPEPTRLSHYFFQQVVSHVPHTEAAGGDATEAAASEGRQPQGKSLLPSESAAAVSASVVACSPSSSPPPSMREPGVSAGVPDLPAGTLAAATARTDAGAPARVTGDAATDRAMWEYFTPASFRHSFEGFVRTESAQTESLRRAVEAAWRDVELIQQRNVARRTALADVLADPDAAWRAEVQGRLYWRATDIVQRYGLEVAVDGEGGADGGETSQTDTARVTLDFSVVRDGVRADRGGNPNDGALKAPRRGSSGSEASDMEDATGGLLSSPHPKQPHQPTAARASTQAGTAALPIAKAGAKTAGDLLHPYARPHFLRRIFAPLQRSRDSLPKWTTLLLRDVHSVQKATLPTLEKRVQSAVVFKVPLHRIFLTARAALQSCVQQQRVAPDAELAQVSAYRQLEQHGKRWVDFVEAHEAAAAVSKSANAGGATAVAASADDAVPSLAQRWTTAEELWALLLDDLDTCKSFFADAIHRCNSVREHVAAEMDSARQSVHTHRRQCGATMAAMTFDAQACAELLNRNGQRIEMAVEEMGGTFTRERDRLRRSITEGEALLARLAGQQEKSARRVREALKAFFMEQLQYEEASQALLQNELSLAQLEASYGQLRQAVQLRYKGATESRKDAADLLQLLADGDAAAQQLFDACEAHCRRIETDNNFIQCRLVDQCTLALQQRYRCVQVMAALYEQRYDTLEARAGDSWQLQFLLSGERMWATENLSDVRSELTQLQQDWRQVCALRAELELEPARLDVHVLTPGWQQLMATLLSLDAPPSLQRRLQTLRAHAAAMEPTAAGCGPQAVHYLLRSAAAATQAPVCPAP
ncbi:hypothetical protein LSCM1_08178 [Leishmania martiniquensis]|uniref:DUF4455 domain-containing protein n=1 Tax=Leishmania martiniquensis TaxID=1580590 RepID=A0A836I552_9TRYP|nr:hypothetical protein LSCM1_08178 [Leishmania martiniquensis]